MELYSWFYKRRNGRGGGEKKRYKTSSEKVESLEEKRSRGATIEGCQTCATDRTVLAANPRCPGIFPGIRVPTGQVGPHFANFQRMA